MENEVYHLNEKHFEWYKQSCRKWLKFFGINCYEFMFFFETDEEAYGQCTVQYNASRAIFHLATEWPNLKPTRQNIDKIAFHEVCECLMMPMTILSEERSVSERELESTRHRIIRTLENVIWAR